MHPTGDMFVYLCTMLTDNEKKFMTYWESARLRESAARVKFFRGLPMALLFSLPIILSVLVVRLYFPEWYAKLSKTSPGMFFTAVVAVLMIACFYAFLRMHIRWENNEQLYSELVSKSESSSAGC